MRRLTDGGVVHPKVAADRAHHHLARIEADADQHLDAVRTPQILGVAADRLLHRERGIARPHRVILVGQRGAEEGHDAVAHDLIHGAFVAMDGVHHSLEHRVEDSPRLLGIPVGQELHRALHVGEEDGDLLALTFQGGARVEDARGEVLRGVRLGCRGGPGIGAGRMRAFRTELRSGREPGSASSARRL